VELYNPILFPGGRGFVVQVHQTVVFVLFDFRDPASGLYNQTGVVGVDEALVNTENARRFNVERVHYRSLHCAVEIFVQIGQLFFRSMG
jgi:hypothetical protein